MWWGRCRLVPVDKINSHAWTTGKYHLPRDTMRTKTITTPIVCCRRWSYFVRMLGAWNSCQGSRPTFSRGKSVAMTPQCRYTWRPLGSCWSEPRRQVEPTVANNQKLKFKTGRSFQLTYNYVHCVASKTCHRVHNNTVPSPNTVVNLLKGLPLLNGGI